MRGDAVQDEGAAARVQAECREDQQTQGADVDEAQVAQVESGADAGRGAGAGAGRLVVQGAGDRGDVRVVYLPGEGQAGGAKVRVMESRSSCQTRSAATRPWCSPSSRAKSPSSNTRRSY